MNENTQTFRNDLMKICEKINSHNFSKNGLPNIASWGSEPDKLLSNVYEQVNNLDRQNVSDPEFRVMIKSYVSND